jgi:hypothetical protein
MAKSSQIRSQDQLRNSLPSITASLTEVLRRSLALYDMLTEHVRRGGGIVLVDRDGKEAKLRIL